jgi:hypothetical protein
LPPYEAGFLIGESKVIAIVIMDRIAVLHLKASEYLKGFYLLADRNTGVRLKHVSSSASLLKL